MNHAADDMTLMRARLRVPEHVVYRPFANETVVLNLQTGQYHGLNPTGGRMLHVVEELGSIAAAAERLSEDYELPPGQLEADLCAFCADLLERGLVELDDPVGP